MRAENTSGMPEGMDETGIEALFRMLICADEPLLFLSAILATAGYEKGD